VVESGSNRTTSTLFSLHNNANEMCWKCQDWCLRKGFRVVREKGARPSHCGHSLERPQRTLRNGQSRYILSCHALPLTSRGTASGIEVNIRLLIFCVGASSYQAVHRMVVCVALLMGSSAMHLMTEGLLARPLECFDSGSFISYKSKHSVISEASRRLHQRSQTSFG
jgi:hypothetical protein